MAGNWGIFNGKDILSYSINIRIHIAKRAVIA